MQSKFKKENVAARANDSDHNDWQHAETVLALIEIREAIEEGFAKLDERHIEAALMLVGCKETFDSFVEHRIKSDKVLSAMLSKVQGHLIEADSQRSAAAEVALDVIAAANAGKKAEMQVKPDTPPAEEKKSRVTLDHGDFGIVSPDSEEA